MKYFLIFTITFLFTILNSFIFIPYLKKLKIGQPIYEYVKEHKEKEGTPTMGGLLFLLPVSIVSLFFCNNKFNVSFFIIVIGFGYMIVGFLDDFLKIKLNHNEGLKPYQKIVFQFAIGIICGIYVYKNGLDYFYIPFTKQKIKLGLYSIPIVIFIFLSITNSVNLTDGIDGLASNVSIAYLLSFIILLFIENNLFESRTSLFDYQIFINISFSLMGGLCGFLFFNTNKAKIFMGDTGSLSIGGLLGALSIFSFNSFYIPIFGIMFVVSSISVLVQVIYYKKTKKRIFLKAPFHHHLQLKGMTEGKICFIYFFITIFFGAFSICFLL